MGDPGCSGKWGQCVSDPFGKQFDTGYQKLKHGILLGSINPLLAT